MYQLNFAGREIYVPRVCGRPWPSFEFNLDQEVYCLEPDGSLLSRRVWRVVGITASKFSNQTGPTNFGQGWNYILETTEPNPPNSSNPGIVTCVRPANLIVAVNQIVSV